LHVADNFACNLDSWTFLTMEHNLKQRTAIAQALAVEVSVVHCIHTPANSLVDGTTLTSPANACAIAVRRFNFCSIIKAVFSIMAGNNSRSGADCILYWTNSGDEFFRTVVGW
jgi:Na+-transporting NADH:ubiquinone oxidoreductase subunit NqrE